MDGPPTEPLLLRWIERVEALDLEGLLDLYDPHAAIESPGGIQYRPDDVEGQLSVIRRFGRKVRLDAAFLWLDGVDTVWESPRGPLRYRHLFRTDGQRISWHRIVRVPDEPPVSVAS